MSKTLQRRNILRVHLHAECGLQESAYAVAHLVEGRITTGKGLACLDEVIREEVVEADPCVAELRLGVELKVGHGCE